MGVGLLILFIIMAAIVWLAWPSPMRTTEEVSQSYFDFIVQGDEASANGLTQLDAVCSAPDPYMSNEIAQQTAVFTNTQTRNLTIETRPTNSTGYPPEAETADIRFEFQIETNPLWLPAHLWIVTMPNAQNESYRAICHLGGSSLFIPQ